MSASTVDRFTTDGFVRIDDAFPPDVADACAALLWEASGARADDRSTWREPVVRLADRTDAPFLAAANAPRVAAVLDDVVGARRWAPRFSVGTFVLRFPSEQAPSDDGWHVDASFPGDAPHDFLQWRVNAESRGRAALLLLLFNDVGDDDAPTRIRVGSHHDVARILAPEGERGLAFRELAARAEAATRDHPVALATGRAGTAYVCHPFLVQAAQAHRGTRPRFMAQPPVFPRPA